VTIVDGAADDPGTITTLKAVVVLDHDGEAIVRVVDGPWEEIGTGGASV